MPLSSRIRLRSLIWRSTLALAACRQSHSAARTAQLPSQVSISPHTAVGAPVPDTNLVVDAAVFEPAGSFGLDTSAAIEYKGFEVAAFDLSQHDSTWFADVQVRRSGVFEVQTYRCPTPMVTRDTLALHCPATPLGPIRIEGRFTDRGLTDPRSPLAVVATLFVLSGSTVAWSYRGRYAIIVPDQ